MFDSILLLGCPDCQHSCPVSFVLLTTDDKVVFLAVCGRCADHATIRSRERIDPEDYLDAARRGLPMVAYHGR